MKLNFLLLALLLFAVIFIIGVIFISGRLQQPVFTPPANIGQNISNVSVKVQEEKAKLPLTSDFRACSGIDTNEKERVAYHRILLAKSSDGLHFERLNKIISDRASVPEMMIDKDGNVRIYFVQVACKEQNLRNNPVVAISSDEGKTWVYKRLSIEAPSDAPQCREPGGNPSPVDPDVVLMPDGRYRLYATCPKGSVGSEQIPMTFVFFSDDGIHFQDGKPTYVPKGKRALDPVSLKAGSQWHLYNGDEKGGTLHAVSLDGITFTEREQFCPFKFTDAKGNQRCYIVGDAIALENQTRYRIYLFTNEPGNTSFFKSIVSTDGENWTLEQEEKEYVLAMSSNAKLEYYEIGSPTVAQLRDGSFLLAYETVIPGTPSTIISGALQQLSVPPTQPSGLQPPPGGQLPGGQPPPPGGAGGGMGGYCGDGICQDIERTTGGCPSDCR
jgi:hypothetical protein